VVLLFFVVNVTVPLVLDGTRSAVLATGTDWSNSDSSSKFVVGAGTGTAGTGTAGSAGSAGTAGTAVTMGALAEEGS